MVLMELLTPVLNTDYSTVVIMALSFYVKGFMKKSLLLYTATMKEYPNI